MNPKIIGLVLIIVVVVIISYYILNKNKRLLVDEVPIVNSSEVRSNKPGFNLILHDNLAKHRDRIFNTFIDDLVVNADITTDIYYNDLIRLLPSEYKSVVDQRSTMVFLIKYKHFLDNPNVYSMGSHNDVDQTFIAMFNIIINKVPGDVVETGVWKGGMSMFMKAVGDHYKKIGMDKHNRNYWLFDAFDVFPDPEPDKDSNTINALDSKIHELTKFMYDKPAKLHQVQRAYRQLNLYDKSVHFVKGLFKDTIPKLKSSQLQHIALLRIDNDYYDSVLYVLEQLYFRINKGGIVIIDDYNNAVIGCKDAVTYFRNKYRIQNPIVDHYGGSIYWIV